MRAPILLLTLALAVFGQQRTQAPAPAQQPRQRQPRDPREQERLERLSAGRQPRMPSDVVLWGRVVMKGGGPPPRPAGVGIHCGNAGAPSVTSTTDNDGNFRIIGGSSSDYGRNGCRVFAALQGYRSSVVAIDATVKAADVGVIFLAPNERVEGTAVSVTSLAAPETAKRAYSRGTRAAKERDWVRAQRELRSAVGEYAKYAEAWHELGTVLTEQRRTDEARSAFEKAIEADQKFVKPHLGLANLAALRRDWADMTARADKALDLNPLDFPAAYFLSAVAQYNLGRLGEAEKSVRTFLELRPANMMAPGEQLLARILRDRGRNAEAAAHLRKYLELAPDAPDAAAARQQIAEFESGAAATVGERQR